MLVAPASGYTLIIYRDPAITQGTDFRENDAFPAEEAEKSLDKAAMISQRLAERLGRTVQLSESFVGSFDLNLPDEVGASGAEGKALIINATRDGFDLGPDISDLDATVAAAAASAAAASDSADSAADQASAASDSADAAAASAAATAGAVAAHEADTTDIHGIPDTSLLATKAGAEVLTNKDIDGGTASNTRRITLPRDTLANLQTLTRKAGTVVYATDVAKFYYDDGSALREVGSGSGSGAIDYIENGKFESNIAGVITFDDGASYVDGTGGSPTAVTISRNTTTPLAGTGDLLISKAASSAVGEGVSIASTTIDRSKRGLRQMIRFEYDFTNANYVGGDVQLKAYDVTNSVILAVTPYLNLDSNGGLYKFKGQALAFVTPLETCTQIRWSLVWATDNASGSAQSLYVDNISLGPDSALISKPTTVPIAFTPTINSNTNVSSNAATWLRDGRFMEVEGHIRYSGQGANSIVTLLLPNSQLIDTNYLAGGTVTIRSNFGFWGFQDNDSAANRSGHVTINSGTNFVTFFVTGTSVEFNSTLTANGDILSYKFRVPIQGWTEGNVISASEAAFQTPAAQAITSSTKTPGASGRWLAMTNNSLTLTPGTYDLSGVIQMGQSGSAGWLSGGGMYALSNGPDTSSVPTAIDSSPTTVQLQSSVLTSDVMAYTTSMGTQTHLTMPIVRIKVLATTTVYLVPFASMSTPASARVVTNFTVTKVPDLTIFGTYGMFETLTAVSSEMTPGAAGRYITMTGGSLTLTPGTWKLTGMIRFSNSGSAAFTNILAGWFGAPGGNSAVEPALLTSLAGLTMLTDISQGGYYNQVTGSASFVTRADLIAPTLIVRVNQPTTIYLAPYQDGTAANIRLRSWLNAERLQ